MISTAQRMTRTILTLVLTVGWLTTAAAAQEANWSVDQICMALWANDGFWYGARVKEVNADGTYAVEFFDGSKSTVTADQMLAEQLQVGDTIGARYQREQGTEWYVASIAERRGMVFVVEYSDGDRETTSLAWLRWRGPNAAATGASESDQEPTDDS